MFTGIIEEVGKVKKITRGTTYLKLSIEATKIMDDIKIGDSIATNGVCLTVTNIQSTIFDVDVMPETFRNTNLKYLNVNSYVNLERAMSASSRFGGHIVTGHIDEVGRIVSIQKEQNATWITVENSNNSFKYLICRGSITIDGVSLTVMESGNGYVKVSIIPHTKTETTLLLNKLGSYVNLEYDVIAKYVDHLVNIKEKRSKVDEQFLKDNGFL